MSFLLPAYGRRSLVDVLPAAATAVGAEGILPETELHLPPRDAYVVMLVDGLGYDLIAEHPREAPYLHGLLGEPGTAGVPSTTVTSLTSLGTALPPGQHGLVGFTSRVPETGALLNALFWDRTIDPLEWQPHATAYERLARAGVETTVVAKADFADSGLTRCSQRGATYVGAGEISERIAGAVAAAARRPSVTYVYDSDLDSIGHRSGVDSDLWRAQLQAVDEDVQDLRAALPADVGLLVVADHGMVDSRGEDRLDVDDHPELRQGLTLLGGEARFRHVYCRPEVASDVAATWAGVLGDRAVVLTRDEAIARGWFGPVEARVLPRLGEVVAAACGAVGLFSSVDFGYETSLVGLHGSLTGREMRIPMILCPPS